MPLYEYECAKCGKRTEAIQRTHDPLLTVCPNCGGALKKLLSAPAFQFKGSGFHVTDYGKSGAKTGETGEKTGENDKEKVSSKGEEGAGSGSGASKGGETGGSGTSDSSKGKKDGAPDAAPSSPAGESPSAPSRKKNSQKK